MHWTPEGDGSFAQGFEVSWTVLFDLAWTLHRVLVTAKVFTVAVGCLC